MNKEDIKKIKNRIAQLERDMESNLAQMRALQIANKSLEGGIIELASMLTNLAPEKKEKAKKK